MVSIRPSALASAVDRPTIAGPAPSAASPLNDGRPLRLVSVTGQYGCDGPVRLGADGDASLSAQAGASMRSSSPGSVDGSYAGTWLVALNETSGVACVSRFADCASVSSTVSGWSATAANPL